MRKSKYCCEKHSDMAFDDFLVENEIFPHLEECSGKKCNYCDAEAKYELQLPENEKEFNA